MNKIKILFLSANPSGTAHSNFDEEVREISSKIRGADRRDSFELITCWAVRPDDLIQALNEHKPHIVHISGHGNEAEEIILLDAARNPKPVTKQALVALFRALKDNVRVVVLNSCFSRPQAEAITAHIDCAIGMKRAIGDRAAITFAASFYRAIAFGRTIEEALEQSKASLMLENLAEDDVPELLTRDKDLARVALVLDPR